MALEAVVFPQDIFGYNCKELYTNMGGIWGNDLANMVVVEEMEMSECEMGGWVGENWNPSSSSLVQNLDEWEINSSSAEVWGVAVEAEGEEAMKAVDGRRKRRRTRSVKNMEEVESQRMTHIAVERNRRRQMNEYLAILRSLMPPSYVQRGDQASIVGGAINYVKELEQLLQSLEVQKRLKQVQTDSTSLASPFANFFAFPQYSSFSGRGGGGGSNSGTVTDNQSAVADIEVTVVESHVNLKVLSKRQPKQLLKMVAGLQNLRFIPLHLNVTTVDDMVLYSFSLKVADDCHFTSVDEIATTVYQMIGRIEEDAKFSK
ncbi:transcription factor bHLH94-like [Ananas comosus]|uniref:Transcription factor bHLH94-like n=1 Tax=Ananas comosus TaxID=4615 RepID=A0A6P5GEA7_ANACO|nr:transcription factor bHLH94-like [Ananas comosus]